MKIPKHLLKNTDSNVQNNGQNAGHPSNDYQAHSPRIPHVSEIIANSFETSVGSPEPHIKVENPSDDESTRDYLETPHDHKNIEDNLVDESPAEFPRIAKSPPYHENSESSFGESPAEFPGSTKLDVKNENQSDDEEYPAETCVIYTENDSDEESLPDNFPVGDVDESSSDTIEM